MFCFRALSRKNEFEHSHPQSHSAYFATEQWQTGDQKKQMVLETSMEFEKGFELKTQQVYFIYPFPRWPTLKKS